MKRRISMLMMVCLILSLSGCSREHGQEEYRLVYCSVEADGSPSDVAMQKFAEYVQERSDGRVSIQIINNGIMGSERELVESLQLGIIQMCYPTASVLAMYDARFNLMELPFLFSDYDSVYDAYDNELGEIFSGWMQEENLLCMGYTCMGFRGLSNSRRPIHTPDDLKGIKLRCIESDMFMNLFSLLGCNPTPMNYNEVYTGLQQGTIDGQDNPPNLTYNSRFYEAQKYYTLSNHVALCVPFIMSREYFDSLPDDIQQIICDGMEAVVAELRQTMMEDEENAIQAMEDAGIEVTTLTEEEYRLFQEKVQPIYDEYREIVGSDVMDLALSY